MEEESDERSSEEEEEPVGPLSLYFPDSLVRLVQKRGSLQPRPSFIEAEQALLFCDGQVPRAVRQIISMRKQKADRESGAVGGRSGVFGKGSPENAEVAKLLRAAPGFGGAASDSGSRWPTHQQTSRWMTNIAGNAILVMVFGSILVSTPVSNVPFGCFLNERSSTLPCTLSEWRACTMFLTQQI